MSCGSAETNIASIWPQTAPHVLEYEVELVVDGRTLDRPVNYALARVVPPEVSTLT